jgi:drug/metabolite transporter (DMT)-like permease
VPRRSHIVLAFAAVYVLWGSTYLAIVYAIETLPPMLMASARFLLAGSIIYVYARLRGAAPPERHHWKPALIIGGLMLLVGNGGVVLAERTVPSGLAALLIASEPLWVALFAWLGARGAAPRGRRLVALLTGFAGVALLVSGRGIVGGDLGGMVLVLVAAAAWAGGSLYSIHAPRPASGLIATSMQMFCGSALQLVAGTLMGDWSKLDPAGISLISVAAFLYLVIAGSLVAYTAYVWLLRVVSPTSAATYAYVNPVVALILGWLVAGEPMTTRTIVAAGIILASVIIITTAPPARAVKPAESPELRAES